MNTININLDDIVIRRIYPFQSIPHFFHTVHSLKMRSECDLSRVESSESVQSSIRILPLLAGAREASPPLDLASFSFFFMFVSELQHPHIQCSLQECRCHTCKVPRRGDMTIIIISNYFYFEFIFMDEFQQGFPFLYHIIEDLEKTDLNNSDPFTILCIA